MAYLGADMGLFWVIFWGGFMACLRTIWDLFKGVV